MNSPLKPPSLHAILKQPLGRYHPWSDASEEECVQFLKDQVDEALATGDSINDLDPGGNPLLFRLLKSDVSVTVQMLDFLLDRGADVNRINGGLNNALHFLLREVPSRAGEHFFFVPEILLDRLRDIRRRGGVPLKDRDGRLIMMQDNDDYLKVVEVLLARLQDINQRNGDDETPCMIAFRQNLPCASFIAAKGGVLDYQSNRNSFGMTRLHQAIMTWDVAVIRALLRAGGDRDLAVTDKAGRTPLHVAAGKKKSAVVDLLLEAGADPEARDGNGKTAARILAEQVAAAGRNDEGNFPRGRGSL